MKKLSEYILTLIAHFTEDLVYEMSNQYEKDTGIPGCIFVSSRMGKHEGRIKYYTNKPSLNGPCLIYSIYNFKVLRDKLGNEVDSKTRKQIIAWIKINQKELIQFWETGYDWTPEQVRYFEDNLKKV